MVLDAPRRRALVFGGWDGTRILNDTWLLTLDPKPAWTLLEPGGVAPPPRVDHAAVFDPEARRMLMFGGFDQAARRFGEVWQLAVSDPAQTRRREQGEGEAPGSEAGDLRRERESAEARGRRRGGSRRRHVPVRGPSF
jgi:hypothetical protein